MGSSSESSRRCAICPCRKDKLSCKRKRIRLAGFSRRGAVASATIYHCAECASLRSAFCMIGRNFLSYKEKGDRPVGRSPFGYFVACSHVTQTAKLLHLVCAVYDLNSLRCLVRLAVCVPNHACTSQAINRDLGHSRL